MKLLDILLAVNVCALFLGNLLRFVSGIFFFPFVHLGLSVLLLYICLSILFDRHAFGSHTLGISAGASRAPGSTLGGLVPTDAGQGERQVLDREKRKLQGLALAMLFFVAVVTVFCLLNSVAILLGVIYAITLIEPFIFLLSALLIKQFARQRALAGVKTRLESLLFYQALKVILLLSFVLGCVQAVLFGGFYDYVKGLFVGAGAGHHVFGGIMSALVIYLAMRLLRVRKVSRRAVALLAATGAAMFMAMLTDTKQLLALALLILVVWILGQTLTTRANAAAKAGSLLTVAAIFFGGWLYLGQFFTSQYDKLVLGIYWKGNTLGDIWRYGRGDLLDPLIGFGPGQTVSKLALMVSDYQGLFSSLGLDISSSPITNVIWDMNQAYWVSNTVTGSSLFSQFFSWAGMLGDIGVIGLLAYAGLVAAAVRVTWRSPTAGLLWTYFVLIGFAFMWLEESPLPVSVALFAAIAAFAEDRTQVSQNLGSNGQVEGAVER